MPKPDPARERYWRGVIADCEGSGLSRIANCRQHGINYIQLQNWRRRLPLRDAETAARRRRETRRAPRRIQKQNPIEFLPVRVFDKPNGQTAPGAGRVELVFKCGTTVRLDSFVKEAGGLAEYIYGDEGTNAPPPIKNFLPQNRIDFGITASASNAGLTTGHESLLLTAWGADEFSQYPEQPTVSGDHVIRDGNGQPAGYPLDPMSALPGCWRRCKCA